MTQYALEWSRSTNRLNILPVANMCANHQIAFIEDVPLGDSHVLMIGTLDAVSRMAASWDERIQERERVRNQPRIRSI